MIVAKDIEIPGAGNERSQGARAAEHHVSDGVLICKVAAAGPQLNWTVLKLHVIVNPGKSGAGRCSVGDRSSDDLYAYRIRKACRGCVQTQRADSSESRIASLDTASTPRNSRVARTSNIRCKLLCAAWSETCGSRRDRDYDALHAAARRGGQGRNVFPELRATQHGEGARPAATSSCESSYRSQSRRFGRACR